MKVLYLECKMGIAGDMLASSLIGLFDDKEKMVDELNNLSIPNVRFTLEDSTKCDIKGNHLTVLVDGEEEESIDVHDHEKHHETEGELHHHKHHSMYDIEEIIEGINISKEVRSDVREVYQLIAEAESEVHGTNVSEIHFHEVGNMDAIADITAVCYLMHELDPDKVIISPINVGSGQVKSAHGILPVPAPATALLLRGIPSYSSDRIMGELCTPTGAALAKYFAFEFGAQPIMTVDRIGYGMGKKDFDQANCVRALLGEANEEIDRILEFSCNIDDMTPEEIGYAKEALFEEGALDVYTIAVDMKKNRPGVLLTCMCKEDRKDAALRCIFRNTTTLGVREYISNRYVLSRETVKLETPYGDVHLKKSFGYDSNHEKLEYEDLAGIARRTGKSIMSLRREIESLNK